MEEINYIEYKEKSDSNEKEFKRFDKDECLKIIENFNLEALPDGFYNIDDNQRTKLLKELIEKTKDANGKANKYKILAVLLNEELDEPEVF